MFRTVSLLLLVGDFLICCLGDTDGKKSKEKMEDLTQHDAEAIGFDAYFYALPLIMNYNVMYGGAINSSSPGYNAPLNAIYNAHKTYTSNDTLVVTPNSDTPYSHVWMDLRAEPLVISFPAINGSRYYSLMLCDGNTYNYAYFGSRTTGNGAGSCMIASPDWKGDKPAGVKYLFRSGSPFSFALIRTQLLNPQDINNVIAIQNQYKVQPLSAYLKKKAPSAPPTLNFPFVNNNLSTIPSAEFFEYLNFLLPLLPTNFSKDLDMRHKLALIGIGPYREFNFTELSPEQQQSVIQGAQNAADNLTKTLSSVKITINGWLVSSGGGNVTYFNGNWAKRALVAKAGIFGNDAAEAVYPIVITDSKGKNPDGSLHNYTLTFAKNAFPPVNAFWSVTMYDAKTQLLVANPINRYLINSPMLPNLVLKSDGSLTIYIQNKQPSGKEQQANWLPAPNGAIYIVMRLYWPNSTAPSILPPGLGTWKPPVLQVA